MTRFALPSTGIRNAMAPGREGGYTAHLPSGDIMTFFDAAQRYRADGVPLGD